MWRPTWVLLALLLITWLEFRYYPGHTYLAARTQLYVPMLEHLQTPAYLTRDLVSTHPQFAYTVYDEAVFFFQRISRGDLQQSLAWIQIICRFAAVFGIYLLARSLAISRVLAVLLAALVNAGALLPGTNAWLTDPEATPRAFAFALTLLAFGLLAKAHPMAAGVCAGISLLFDPAIAAPFWIVTAVVALFDRSLRKSLRPLVPVFVVFVLLLANLAQLQPGTPDSQSFLDRIPAASARIQQFRSPELWLSLWHSGAVHFYFAVYVLVVWAVVRGGQESARIAKWILLFVPLLGLVALPFSWLSLDHLRFATVLRWRPSELCAYIVALVWIALGSAVQRAVRLNAKREAALWLAVCVALGCVGRVSQKPEPLAAATERLANWAAVNTWGSSMFAFPDAGQARYPGVFRALSLRALWTDWESGRQINNTLSLTPVWWDRWQETMPPTVTGNRLQQMLEQPIDYYVFRRDRQIETLLEGRLSAVPAIYSDSNFRVFEANTLRLIPGRLVVVSREVSSRKQLQLPR